MSQKEEQLREALVNARETIEQQQAVLAQIATDALGTATILALNETRMVINKGGEHLTVMRPPNVQLKVADTILVTRDSNQFIEKTTPIALGALCAVLGELDDSKIEVSAGGSQIAVLRGPVKGTIKQGDRVILDKTNSIVVQHFVGEGAKYDFKGTTGVHWNDIGGQEQAKRDLIEAIELPRKHPEIFQFYNKRPIKGVLLEGPPGCGKTMLAKAAATAIGGAKAAFMYVKGAEILDPYVGVAEATIRALFARAREHMATTGVPALIFIDEADALLGKRGERHAMMEKTIVPTFLAEMDGLEENGAIVMLATNRADSLDPAVTREGRMDRKVRVTRPNQEDAAQILSMYLSKAPVAPTTTVETLVKAACDAIYSHTKVYYDAQLTNGETRTFSLAHLTSGAMLAGVVDQATSLALHRDLDNGQNKPSGISVEDLHAAIHRVYQQNLNVDHTEALQDFAGELQIVNLTKRTENHAAKTA